MDADSLENQRNYCFPMWPPARIWNWFEMYEDNGFTGTDFERPDFQRMMEDVQKGKINCIVVKDLSRLAETM